LAAKLQSKMFSGWKVLSLTLIDVYMKTHLGIH
jgi:hypothetical protein